MKEIVWGIVGCGDVTEVKSGPAFNRIARSRLQAVMRRTAVKAEEYARRHSVPVWYDDAERLFSNPSINAVYIATPPSSHKDYALAALARGLFVYLEKPAALNAVETREIADSVHRNNGKLTVAHYRRKLPSFAHVKFLLDQHAIGDIRTARITVWQSRRPAAATTAGSAWRTDPAISGGGYFHDLSPHQLDLMLHFFGTPGRLSGFSMNQSRRDETPDMVTGSAVFGRSILFSGSWNFNIGEQPSRDDCTIVGTQGKISFPFFGSTVTVTDSSGTETVYRFENPAHVQQPMIEAVVRYFLGEGENPCSIDEALAVMQMIDAFSAPM